MSRTIIIAVLLLYTFAASGASVHLHFCGAHLVDYSMMSSDHEGCCCEEKDECIPEKPGFSKPCCTDHIASAKINDDQYAKTVSTVNVKPVAYYTFNFDCRTLVRDAEQYVSPVSHAPPLPGRCEVFLFIRSIRI